MARITAENLAGLVVGEGCFYVESKADPKYRLGWRIRPAFCIEMRADERDVLEAARDLLGCGAVYDLDFGRYRGYEKRNWHPHAKFRVTRMDDLRYKVVPFFEVHPLFGRKLIAFRLFASIVEALSMGLQKTPEGLRDVKKLAEDLQQHNARGKQAAPSV